MYTDRQTDQQAGRQADRQTDKIVVFIHQAVIVHLWHSPTDFNCYQYVHRQADSQ